MKKTASVARGRRRFLLVGRRCRAALINLGWPAGQPYHDYFFTARLRWPPCWGCFRQHLEPARRVGV